MRQVAAIRALAEHVVARVHPSASDEPGAVTRHAAFIATHVAVGVLPFAALPVLLALAGTPGVLELAVVGWLAAPIVLALHLSTSGDLPRAHLLSSLSLTVLIAGLSAATGGLASPVLPWLVLAPLEAALSGSRRATVMGVAAALTAAAGVGALGALIVSPSSGAAGVGYAVAGGLWAVAYAIGLAIRVYATLSAAAASLRETRARFDMITGAVEDLATRHAPNGAVTFASGAGEKLLGASGRDLQGFGLFERVHVADRPAFLQAIASAAGGLPVSTEIRLRRGGTAGSAPRFGWFHMAARPGAEAGAALAMFRDVTDAKAQSERVAQAEQAAERAVAEKTRFLASVSHELRTPLTSILGFSEILADDGATRSVVGRRSDYGRLIHQAAQHLLEIVDGVLEMAKLEAGAFAITPEPCSLQPVVARCVGLLALNAERGGVRVVADVGGELPDIVADRRALTQVTLNLLSNAIKFTPSGGEVTVSLRASCDAVVLSVRDTGAGVAPEHLDQLGEAFFQAQPGAGRHREGAGLGLSIVRGLVALHGGRLGFESALGRGTRVTVRLPIDPARPLSDSAVERPAFGRPRTPALTEMKVKQRA